MSGLAKSVGYLCLLLLCGSSLYLNQGPSLVYGEDDVVGENVAVDDELEAEVENEGEEVIDDTPPPEDSLASTESESEVEGQEEEALGPSPDADFVMIFNSKKTGASTDFVAGEPTTALIGLSNRGESAFTISAIEGSLRFPQDFSYHIQNFSVSYYEQYVAPETDASFIYAFQPSEMFTSRAFGFVLSVYYKDSEDKEFRSAVFNDTVNIVEIEEGFDGETFFMYIFMISGLCLLMFIAHYVYTNVWATGGSAAKKAPIERGTQGKEQVAYDPEWLPAGTIPTPKKSPKPRASPKPGSPKSESSPRKRRSPPS